MDKITAPTLHECAVSGAQSAGKHYVLTTTEGQELVCPEALFRSAHTAESDKILSSLAKRVRELEDTVDALIRQNDERDQVDNEDQAEDQEHAGGAVKKTAAKKTAANKAGA